MGLSKSLNKGIRLSNHTLIARQDADDISHPNRIEKQVRYMQNNPGFRASPNEILRVLLYFRKRADLRSLTDDYSALKMKNTDLRLFWRRWTTEIVPPE